MLRIVKCLRDDIKSSGKIAPQKKVSVLHKTQKNAFLQQIVNNFFAFYV